MQRGIGITMQIEHHISDAGMTEQDALHALQFALRRRQTFERSAHCLANQPGVGVRVVAQLTFQQLGDRLAQLSEVTVEILATAELETALMRALQQLPQAQRVGHRHQFDDTFEEALLLQLGEAFFSSQAVRMPGSSSACRLAWM